MNRPVVLVGARRTTRKNKFIDYVGELHLELLIRLRTLPIIVPVVTGTPACLPQYMERMDGLLLVEGEDVEPKHFAAHKANFQYLEKTHALKDEIEIRLLRHALRREIPILGICRGSQLLNVVCGGTLYGDVQKEKGLAPPAYQLSRLRCLPSSRLCRSRNSSRALVSPENTPREQLSSPGNSRIGSALPAHGACR